MPGKAVITEGVQITIITTSVKKVITVMYAEGAGSVDHMLVDCVDLQRRPLWHHVLACPAATHLLDPSSHRLYPKVTPCTIPTRLLEAFKSTCVKVEMDVTLSM